MLKTLSYCISIYVGRIFIVWFGLAYSSNDFSIVLQNADDRVLLVAFGMIIGLVIAIIPFAIYYSSR